MKPGNRRLGVRCYSLRSDGPSDKRAGVKALFGAFFTA